LDEIVLPPPLAPVVFSDGLRHDSDRLTETRRFDIVNIPGIDLIQDGSLITLIAASGTRIGAVARRDQSQNPFSEPRTTQGTPQATEGHAQDAGNRAAHEVRRAQRDDRRGRDFTQAGVTVSWCFGHARSVRRSASQHQ
jgi:hypothetical protein